MANHEADFKDEKFKIIITVAKNCQSITVECVGEYSPTYQEIIGALEIQKAMYLYDQSCDNRKLDRKEE